MILSENDEIKMKIMACLKIIDKFVFDWLNIVQKC